MKYIVSYGGGVDSTAMIFKLVEDNAPLDYVVFADLIVVDPNCIR